MAPAALARVSARAATVVAVASIAVTLAPAESEAAFEPSVAAFEPVTVIGGSGGGAGRLGIPLGVATDGVEALYATEHVNQRVSRFRRRGNSP